MGGIGQRVAGLGAQPHHHGGRQAGAQAGRGAFGYLGWYRARQLARPDRAEEGRRWWRWQRSWGLSLAVWQRAEEADLAQLYRWSATPTGRRKLRRCLRQALPLEYRPAA